MAEASEVSGGALDATVATEDHRPDDDPILRAQGLLDEADDLLDRMQRKHDKIKLQYDDVKQSLADARQQQKDAKAHLASVKKGGDE